MSFIEKEKILFHVEILLKLTSLSLCLSLSHTGKCHCQGSVQEMEFILQFRP